MKNNNVYILRLLESRRHFFSVKISKCLNVLKKQVSVVSIIGKIKFFFFFFKIYKKINRANKSYCRK